MITRVLTRRSQNLHSVILTGRSMSSLYYFKATLNSGEEVSLSKYTGVTDSEYKALQSLHESYANQEKGLRILAFPCNQFGKQEPASDAAIAEFVKKYNFQGELFQKIEVNGKNAHPLWSWMKTTPKGKGTLGNDIKWNFTKFVVDRQGQVVERAATTTSSAKLAPQIEKLLQSPFE
ncbi:Oidioi.mRNA.OKI2018_I69.PAR.g9530.t1.cds [Oikopleura dioica]|uniref:Glutathione peroxidase n=1 Tax=Oikopleura dioica TaxID=34765 RepID=A0ABN7RPS4_OIKDI|nr:Oidioi.mRNA.OKI2018_I69.PAR.g9530.t1.cds [Oikopleura dioica]